MAETWEEKQKAAQDFIAWRAAQEGAAPTTTAGTIPQGALVPLLVEEAERRRGIKNWGRDNPNDSSLYPTDEWAEKRYWEQYWANQPRFQQGEAAPTPVNTVPTGAAPAGLMEEPTGIGPPLQAAGVVEEVEVDNVTQRLHEEYRDGMGDATPLDVAKVVAESTDNKTPADVIASIDSWTASDAGLESTEARRKRYMKDMNDIFTKAMMLKVLSNLSGNDGEDMSKMFMQFAFEKMDKRKEFAGEDRLKKIRDKVYYRRNAAGEMIFDAPKFRSVGYERVLAVGGDATDAKGMFGHLPIKKQPSTTKANYRVWSRIVDGKVEEIPFRGDEMPPLGEHKDIPWLPKAYVLPTKKAGTEYVQFRARARALLAAGDRDGAYREMRAFWRKRENYLQAEITPQRLKELTDGSMDDLGAGSAPAKPDTRDQARIELKQSNPGKSETEIEARLDNMGYPR